MKRKFIIISALTLLGSCLVSCVNTNLLIGSWKQEKIDYIPMKTDSLSATKLPKVLPGDQQKDGSENLNDNIMDFKRSVEQIASPNLDLFWKSYKPVMVFKENMTATIYFLNDTVNGSWKMNGGKSKIVIDDKRENQKIVVNLSEINSDYLLLTEKYSEGTYLVKYRRQK
jgi:hypothetical protein